MNEDLERRIRERAHRLWEQEGRPEGRDAQHWAQAREMVEREAGPADGHDSSVGDPGTVWDSGEAGGPSTAPAAEPPRRKSTRRPGRPSKKDSLPAG